MNKGKPKVMKYFRSGKRKVQIFLDCRKLLLVDPFKYFENYITSDGTYTLVTYYVELHNKEVGADFFKERSLLASRNVFLETRKKFMKSFIWSMCTYGSKARKPGL